MIEFRKVNYYINHKPILEDINLKIMPNEFVAIIGPNGAGKSTLIKILLNIITDYTGEVFIQGVSNKKWLKFNKVGYLPQKEDFDRDFPATVKELILMGRMAYKGFFRRISKIDFSLIEEAVASVGISHLVNAQIGSLSGGEWQRTLLARALVTKSNILILDEPEASMDKIGVSDFFELLATLHKQGKTIITVSHDLHTLSRYCTYLICLNRTLHCHTETELMTAEHIQSTFGDTVKLIEKNY